MTIASPSDPSATVTRSDDRVPILGTILGLLAAVGYTASNACLRAADHNDPFFVSVCKAFPTILLTAPWLAWDAWHGRRFLPDWEIAIKLCASGLVAHLAGNVAFQWSLPIVGIAMAVPLSLGGMIVSGAVLGRTLIGEVLTKRVIWAIGILLIAVAILATGAVARNEASTTTSVVRTMSENLLGVGLALSSGCFYALLGTTIRHGIKGRANPQQTIFIVGLVGVVSVGAVALARVGLAGALATSAKDWGLMFFAGVFNAAAFLALTHAFRRATLTYVQSLNATQAAMAGFAGVTLFGERLTWHLVVGAALTVGGLWLMNARSAVDKARVE